IPLTLAIVSALILGCGGHRFAIPQISVVELVRASAHSEHAIELINDSPVLRLRDRLLPLINLKRVLKLDKQSIGNGANESTSDEASSITGNGPGTAAAGAQTIQTVETDPRIVAGLEKENFIVVSQVGSYIFGIIVDQVFDTEEIVVKPVSSILKDIPFYSGNTILGDGSVIMILDPNGIASIAGQEAMAVGASAETAPMQAQETTVLLVFRAGGKERKAVPMALVARLEEVNVESIEIVNGQRVVQYRGHLMPLITFGEDHEWQEKGREAVLVFSDEDRSMGLVVSEIVDIVEDHLKVELGSERDGIIGSAIINNKATDIIDVSHFLTRAYADWFGAGTTGSAALDGQQGAARLSGKRVLVVDDSRFFRNLIVPFLSVAGYEVFTAENGSSALQMLDRGAHFDAIVSDIEMPGMNGFEFAESVKADGRWTDTPLIALSSRAGQDFIERGKRAGFQEYVAKTKRDDLLAVLEVALTTPSDERAAGGAA
ncbi:MAG: chemotaxis protein CheW, partial [Rhodospirillales bacterium]